MLDVVVYANSPTTCTGFGTVIKNVFEGVLKQVPMNLSIYGINYHGEPHDLDWAKVWPAQHVSDPGDPYGRARFCDLMLQEAWPCDVLYVLEDHFNLVLPVPFGDGMKEPMLPGLIRRMREQVRQGKRKDFKVVQYLPVDSECVWPEWVNFIPQLVDYPVAYTQFGRRVLTDLCGGFESKIRVIPHGTNPETFFPLPKDVREQIRREVFKLEPGDPMILCVNRNQIRKDQPRLLQVFKRVLKRIPKAKLHLHCDVWNPHQGFHLDRVRINMRIPDGKVGFPLNHQEGIGITLEKLNCVYNAADVFVTTARGEGWGLPVSESMAAGLPVVAIDHTSHTEILEDGRGVLVPPDPIGEVTREDWDQIRPVADVEKMTEAVCGLLEGPEEYVGEMRRKALEWAQANSWERTVVPMWVEIFKECEDQLRRKPVEKTNVFSLQEHKEQASA